MMQRSHAFQIIAPLLKDAIVVPVYSSAFDWRDAAPDHERSLFAIGAMGLASSHAIGLALAFPGRKVVVFDGDGSALMNLGTMVTATAAGVSNLVHIVVENGMYEANGGHPIPNRGRIDFAAMARAAGYDTAVVLDKPATLADGIRGLLAAPGPAFGVLKAEGPAVPRRFALHDYLDLYGPERLDRLGAKLVAEREAARA
jgi:thiamine pyrophosphate-dependent acetolactate synthase large subunit-like protein